MAAADVAGFVADAARARTRLGQVAQGVRAAAGDPFQAGAVRHAEIPTLMDMLHAARARPMTAAADDSVRAAIDTVAAAYRALGDGRFDEAARMLERADHRMGDAAVWQQATGSASEYRVVRRGERGLAGTPPAPAHAESAAAGSGAGFDPAAAIASSPRAPHVPMGEILPPHLTPRTPDELGARLGVVQAQADPAARLEVRIPIGELLSGQERFSDRAAAISRVEALSREVPDQLFGLSTRQGPDGAAAHTVSRVVAAVQPDAVRTMQSNGIADDMVSALLDGRFMPSATHELDAATIELFRQGRPVR